MRNNKWLNIDGQKLDAKLNSKLTQRILIVLFLIYIAIESLGNGDFYIYYTASSKVFGNESIYNMLFGDGFHYLYSLFFSICLYPFTFLPFYLCKFLWLLLNGYLLVKIFNLLGWFLNKEDYSLKQPSWFYVLVFLFSFRFIHENFHASQISIVILYLCIQSVQLIFHGKKVILGSVLLAIGINIKLLPIIILPYLVYRAKFKSVLYVVLTCMFLWLIPSVILGHQKNVSWLHDWWSIMNPSNKLNVLDVSERSFHSLTTLFATLFVEQVPDIYALKLKRNLLDISIEHLALILNITRLVLVGLMLYFVKTLPFKNALSKKHQLYELSYLLAVVPLIFPHQQHYAFIFMLPAITVLLYYVVHNFDDIVKQKKGFLLLVVLVFLLFNLKILLGEFNPYYEHFKILTYGALILLGLLFYNPIKKSFT